MSDSLPGCVGYYKMPVFPNDCETCSVRETCRKVIARERLKPIFDGVEELERIVKEGPSK